MKKVLLLLVASLGLYCACAQQPVAIGLTEAELAQKLPWVNMALNRIFNTQSLDPFYEKLKKIKRTGKGVVNIVHIGDSHLQPDFVGGELRNLLQSFFGNAGRGLVFPHRLAGSNPASDVVASSNVKWRYNRIVYPDVNMHPGLSGFVVETPQTGATINMDIKGFSAFNTIKVFTNNSGWVMNVTEKNNDFILPFNDTLLPYRKVELPYPVTSFSMYTLPNSIENAFYGAVLENGRPGVLVHTIGVNGARYDHYNRNPLFWKQLAGLNADLFIISLGTNEAQNIKLNTEAFQAQVDQMLENIRKSSPKASILICTTGDSYRSGAPNAALRDLNNHLASFCNIANIPLWNLYQLSNGMGSARLWHSRRLMAADRLHFTAEGYKLQGALLFNAIARGYNNYISAY